MSEKPLHVRVAEALGWTHCYRKTEYTDFEPWRGFPPSRAVVLSGGVSLVKVPHYDTDWSATGPLIERYTIHLDPHGPDRADQGWAWQAYQFDNESVWGDTPLLAVCNLILALSKAGKL